MIRLFKLGSLEHNIFPTSENISKLKEMIDNIGGSDKFSDIIWGPDLQIEIIPETTEEALALAKLKHG